MDAGQAHHFRALNIKLWQGSGKRHGLGQPMFGQAARLRGFQRRVQHIGAGRGSGGIAQALPLTRGEQIVLVLAVA